MPKKKKFKKFVTEDMGDQLIVADENQAGSGAALPDELDVNFIKDQIYKLKKSQSATAAYFRSLRARFGGKAQLKVIQLMEEINQAMASGIASETVILKKQQALVLAERELWVVRQDFEEEQKELERKQRERDIELMNLESEYLAAKEKLKRQRKAIEKGEDDKADKKDGAKDEDFDLFDD